MLGDKIATLRKNKGLSQYELAERLGFSRGKLANYEQGSRQPDYETLNTIASYFNLSTDYLLGRTDNPSILEEPINKNTERDYPLYDSNGVQFIARSDKNLSPAAYKKMQELAKKAAELFDEDDE